MSLSLFNPFDDHKSVKVSVELTGAIEYGYLTRSKILEIPVLLEKDGAWHHQLPIKGKTIGDGQITLTLSGEGFETIKRTFEITVRPSTPLTSTKATYLLHPGEFKALELKEYLTLVPNTATLTISASDHIPWDLTTILKALTTYPYGCVEQTVSKGFAILYKKSMGILQDAETKEDLDKSIFKVLSILAEKQDREGGQWHSVSGLP